MPEILPGVCHDIPDDIEIALRNNPDILTQRNALTPLARNEWICRVTIVKKQETRQEHIQRLVEDIGKNKKRPCCRPGCPHNNSNAKKWFKNINM